MSDLLSRVPPHDVAAIVFSALAFVAGLVVWLTYQWRLHRRTEIEAALKQDMLDRGMSAEDIERVMRASLGGSANGLDQTSGAVPRAKRATSGPV